MTASRPFGLAGEFAASRHGALTRAQAAASGISRHVVARLLRDEVLTEPTPGVLVIVGSPDTWRQRMTVATLAASAAGTATARSAAALHGMDAYEDGPIELLIPTSRHIHLPGLVIHRGPLPPMDVTVVDGISCTSIARTLCELGRVDPVDRVRLAFEWAWRNGTSLTWIRRTAERLSTPRSRGPHMVLALLDEAARHGRPTESSLEVRVEDVIERIPGVVRQHRIHRADGSFVARVDFAIPELRLAIEAHSREHHFGIAAFEADARRDSELLGVGWIVRYVTDRERRRPAELRRSLTQLIATRRAQLGLPGRTTDRSA